MRTCQESATYLHSLGISDEQLAKYCDIESRAYMNQVRNGRRAGGPELQAKLDSFCEQAIEHGISVQRAIQRPKRPASNQVVIVDAIPPTGYSNSQEIIPYAPGQEDTFIEDYPPKNRRAPHPIYDNPLNSPGRMVQDDYTSAQERKAQAFSNAAQRFKDSFLGTHSSPGRAVIPRPSPMPDTPAYRDNMPVAPAQNIIVPQPAQVPQRPEHISKWQRVKAAYRYGLEVERQEREARRRR